MTEDTYSGRLEIRLPKADRDAVLEAAKREGVNKSEWCRRVFANVLGTPQVEAGPSEAEDAIRWEQSGPTSVPSEAVKQDPSEGVRPAAQSQTPPARDLMAELKASLKPEGSDAEAKPKRITQPPRRADVGPKPVSATKPRPKATKPKGKR